MDDTLDKVEETAEGLVAAFGYLGVAVLAFLDIVIPPLPSEVVLPIAGFPAGRDQLSFLGTVVAATIGATLGALVLYGIGRFIGEERLRGFLRTFGIKHLLCLLYTSPSPRDRTRSRMPSSA